MSSPQAAVSPDAAAPLSEPSRLIGVFASPKEAFADIVARPRWYVPAILIALVGLCFMVLFSQRVGFDRMMQQQFDQNPRFQTMTAEQRESAMKMTMAIVKPSTFATAVVAPAVMAMVIGAVIMLIANSFLGSQLQFWQATAIAAYASLPSVVSTILATIVMFIRSPDEFDLKNPLAFNIGAFLNADTTPKWLLSLCTSLDVFSFWTMALIAIGIMVATRKLSFSKAFVAVLIPWAIVILLKAGVAAVTG